MYEYVPLDDPGCSLTRILRQPFRSGLAPRRETGTGDYHHGGIGPTCPLPRDRRAGPHDPLGAGFACTWCARSPRGSDHQVPIVRLPGELAAPVPLLGRE